MRYVFFAVMLVGCSSNQPTPSCSWHIILPELSSSANGDEGSCIPPAKGTDKPVVKFASPYPVSSSAWGIQFYTDETIDGTITLPNSNVIISAIWPAGLNGEEVEPGCSWPSGSIAYTHTSDEWELDIYGAECYDRTRPTATETNLIVNGSFYGDWN